ncbi:unnamed protein product [Lepidochelys olivacea]
MAQDAKDPHSSVGLSARCRGLWSECVFDNMANLWTCDIPISYLSEHSGSICGTSAKRPFSSTLKVLVVTYEMAPTSQNSFCPRPGSAQLIRRAIPVPDFTLQLSAFPSGAVLVITRALVILTGIFCLGAVPCLIAGMKCTKLISEQVHQKYKFSLAAGTLFFLGGLSGAIAVLCYAVDTVQKYRLEVSLGIPGVTYELGYSYWMAAAGTICTCVTGILLIVASCASTRTPRRWRRHPRVCLPPASQRKGTYL